MVEGLVDDHMEDIMMIRRSRMRIEVAAKTRGEKMFKCFPITTIEIRGEEAEDNDLEEEASMGNVFNMKKMQGLKQAIYFFRSILKSSTKFSLEPTM